MAATDAPLTAAPGVYVLGLHLDTSTWLPIGALGPHWFEAGLYLYVGSAWGPGGLAARVTRHLRGGPVRRWHIDYLRAVAVPVAVWLAPGSREECGWATRLLALQGARIPLVGFGTSDCHCRTHLIFMAVEKPAPAWIPDMQYVVPITPSADNALAIGTATRF